MEARLTDPTSAAPRAPLQDTPARSGLPAHIDRYLQAAGAADPALRSRLVAATLRDLRARGVGSEPGWAQIVASVDRGLVAAMTVDGIAELEPSARGRVALGLTRQQGEDEPAGLEADWGTPPRRHLPMQEQDLSAGRLPRGADGLQRWQIGRAAMGLAGCLCWILVLIVP